MRFELQQKTDLALKVLSVLVGRDGWCKSAELADRVGTTPGVLAHAVRPIVRAGWVESSPGSRGGYRRASSLDGVSVLDVIMAVEGPIEERCVLRHSRCNRQVPCTLHEAWNRARQALIDELERTPVVPVRI